jgi:hypothetical protein
MTKVPPYQKLNVHRLNSPIRRQGLTEIFLKDMIIYTLSIKRLFLYPQKQTYKEKDIKIILLNLNHQKIRVAINKPFIKRPVLYVYMYVRDLEE